MSSNENQPGAEVDKQGDAEQGTPHSDLTASTRATLNEVESAIGTQVSAIVPAYDAAADSLTAFKETTGELAENVVSLPTPCEGHAAQTSQANFDLPSAPPSAGITQIETTPTDQQTSVFTPTGVTEYDYHTQDDKGNDVVLQVPVKSPEKEEAPKESGAKVSEIVTEDGIDYATYEPAPGDYWMNSQGGLTAFVLECDDFSVIVQRRTTENPETRQEVFDFPFGQELISIRRFRNILERNQSKKVVLNKTTADIAIRIYHDMMDRFEGIRVGRIVPREHEPTNFVKKVLPGSEQERNELHEHEFYRVEKQVVPPPLKYRNRNGTHWLMGGIAGTQPTLGYWDAEMQTYVTIQPFSDSDPIVPDPTKKIDFGVTSYHSPCVVSSTSEGEMTPETIAENILTKLLDMGYIFADQEKSRNTIVTDCNTLIDIMTGENNGVAAVHPAYTLSVTIDDEDGPSIHLSHDGVVHLTCGFDSVQNGQFIDGDFHISRRHTAIRFRR